MSEITSKRIAVAKTYKLFVDGKFPRTESGRYFKLADANGMVIANICQASRKDFRDAIVAARKAQPAWAGSTAYNKGQILYRIAEVMEGRREQFIDEFIIQGFDKKSAIEEVNNAIDLLIYFAGWSDKYQAVFSSVNPVATSHFNFSHPEPTGVVAAIICSAQPLVPLVHAVATAIVGGNSIVALIQEKYPLTAITFGEVLHSSDVPAGVVNLLTGFAKELASHMSSHMDVNAIIYQGDDKTQLHLIENNASLNVKRVAKYDSAYFLGDELRSPYSIVVLQELKTTWHPIGI
jgi:acyl-CoA reductase-like NAD-dependent aldehyde dehydrogenase